jgi:prepilin-type N-terminal cleavage/methylation domain-containing protein
MCSRSRRRCHRWLLPLPKTEQGFTLTELAVVLVIVALLIGGMLIPIAAQDDLRRAQETDKTLNDAKDALLGFAASQGRLPRPATSATNGAENPASCANDAACSGFIPWATLGVSKLDAWGKIIRYSVTPAYANAAFSLSTVANRRVQTRDSAGNLSYLIGQMNCTAANQCAPAVIFSHGKNNWGTGDSGSAMTDNSNPDTNVDEDANNAGPTSFISRIVTDNKALPGGEFDDLVTWLSLNILFNRMIAAGRLP